MKITQSPHSTIEVNTFAQPINSVSARSRDTEGRIVSKMRSEVTFISRFQVIAMKNIAPEVCACAHFGGCFTFEEYDLFILSTFASSLWNVVASPFHDLAGLPRQQVYYTAIEGGLLTTSFSARLDISCPKTLANTWNILFCRGDIGTTHRGWIGFDRRNRRAMSLPSISISASAYLKRRLLLAPKSPAIRIIADIGHS